MDLKKYIRTVPDFPQKGIQFRDITTLLQNPEAFSFVVDTLADRYKDSKIDSIAEIESRGFIFGAALAHKLGCSLVLIRKKGKLPASVKRKSYDLEYGSATIEIHADAITKDQNVLVIDDLLATGGTLAAAAALVEELGGSIAEIAVVIELPDLDGRKNLEHYAVHSLVRFAGE